MKRYLLAFCAATVLNFGFDFLILGGIRSSTLSWEYGVIQGLIWYWAVGPWVKEN
jgi:hypothetical protein